MNLSTTTNENIRDDVFYYKYMKYKHKYNILKIKQIGGEKECWSNKCAGVPSLDRPFAAHRPAAVQHGPGHRSVHDPGVKKEAIQRPGQPQTDGALAGGCRAVNGDDGRRGP